MILDREACEAASLGEFDRLESAVRSYSRKFDCVFAKARDARIFDTSGRAYLDLLCGAGALSYGHNNRHIKQAIVDYLENDGILSSLDLFTTAKLEFLRRFRETILAPRELDYRVQFCGPTGTDAVEAALKLARKATSRQGIIAFTKAYHGVSLGALATTASAQHRAVAGVALENVTRMPFDGFLGPNIDTVDVVEAMLARGSGIDLPAAILLETVQAEGGLHVASAGWLRRLEDLARRHGILLIVDDVQVGCGRTGRFFSFERAGLKPDIVCLSKAIGGVGLPMAVTLIRPSLDVWEPGDHAGTFRGNNLAFVGATAALHYWELADFEQALEARSRRIRAALVDLLHRHRAHFAEVRGLGMIQGLACRSPDLARRIIRAAFANGLILESAGPKGEVLKLLPPLVISCPDLDEALSILAYAVEVSVAESALAEHALSEGLIPDDLT